MIDALGGEFDCRWNDTARLSTGASLVACILGVKKQTVYNGVSSGKTVAGCRIQKEEETDGRRHTGLLLDVGRLESVFDGLTRVGA